MEEITKYKKPRNEVMAQALSVMLKVQELLQSHIRWFESMRPDQPVAGALVNLSKQIRAADEEKDPEHSIIGGSFYFFVTRKYPHTAQSASLALAEKLFDVNCGIEQLKSQLI